SAAATLRPNQNARAAFLDFLENRRLRERPHAPEIVGHRRPPPPQLLDESRAAIDWRGTHSEIRHPSLSRIASARPQCPHHARPAECAWAKRSGSSPSFETSRRCVLPK